MKLKLSSALGNKLKTKVSLIIFVVYSLYFSQLFLVISTLDVVGRQ